MHNIYSITVLLIIALLTGCRDGNVRPADSSPGTGATPAATGCDSAPPGEPLREAMVCAHNAVRQSPPGLQPVPEPPLPPLTWNEELAELARAHAEQCLYQHSERETRTERFGQWVGENVAAGTAAAYSDRSVVNRWAEEAANYDYRTNSCDPGKVCGHYTQIVWRDALQVGCAKVTCDTIANQPGLGEADLWVCNYLPGGNIVGKRPY